MAERRMFAKTIIDSDAFTEMPLSTQALYFHLSLRADDDGFLNCAQKIMRMIGAAKNDYDVLLAMRFVIQFNDGICVIKHWRIHNYIQSDRYKPTVYQEEKAALSVKSNGSYTLKEQSVKQLDTPCIQDGYTLEAQVRLGKDSIVKDSTDSADKPRRFVKPTVEEIAEYCTERQNKINPQSFFDWNESKGWKVGNSPMKDWKAAIRTWEQREKDKTPDKPKTRYFYPDENGNPTEGWR